MGKNNQSMKNSILFLFFFRNGAPVLKDMGPVFARDGDNLVIKTSLLNGSAPFNISWTVNGQPLVWSQRIKPYNKTGCVGISIRDVGFQDEGFYNCCISNSAGGSSFGSTLVVDCKYELWVLVKQKGFLIFCM